MLSWKGFAAAVLSVAIVTFVCGCRKEEEPGPAVPSTLLASP